MRRILLLTFTALLALSSLWAQESPSVVSGSRVRVWAVEPRIVKVQGTIIKITPESLTFRPSDLATTVSARQATDGALRMSMQRVTRLDVSAGRRSRGRGAARGAGLGALFGLGASLVVASFEAGSCSAETCGLVWLLYPPAGIAADSPSVGSQAQRSRVNDGGACRWPGSDLDWQGERSGATRGDVAGVHPGRWPWQKREERTASR